MKIEFIFIPKKNSFIKIHLFSHGQFYEAFGSFNGLRKYKRSVKKTEAINGIYKYFLEHTQ